MLSPSGRGDYPSMDSRPNVTFTPSKGGALVPLPKSFGIRVKRAPMARHIFGISQIPRRTKIASATMNAAVWERVIYNPPTKAKFSVMDAVQLVTGSGEVLTSGRGLP
jgi:hypothetical protein